MNWIISNIDISIDSGEKPNGIFRNESPHLRVIPACPVIHEASQRIAFAAGEVVARVGAASAVAIAIVGDLFGEVALLVRQRGGAAEMILQEIEWRLFLARGAGLANLVVDAWTIQVIVGRAVAVDVSDNVLTVVDEIRRDGGASALCALN